MRISDWSSDVCSSDLNVQLGRHLIERQSHLEPVFVDLQVPIEILDDDRHLVGKALQQMLWDIHAGRARAEGDVEMMGSGQAACFLHLAKDAADDGAQGVLHDLVIGNKAVWRSEEQTYELKSIMRISY